MNTPMAVDLGLDIQLDGLQIPPWASYRCDRWDSTASSSVKWAGAAQGDAPSPTGLEAAPGAEAFRKAAHSLWTNATAHRMRNSGWCVAHRHRHVLGRGLSSVLGERICGSSLGQDLVSVVPAKKGLQLTWRGDSG